MQSADCSEASRHDGSRLTVCPPPCFLYYYLETHYAKDPEGANRYRLETILPCKAEEVDTSSHYYSRSIEHSALGAVDMAHLQLFNSICIPESNARTMRFTFVTLHHGAYSCLVTPTGQLAIVRYDAIAPGYDSATALMPACTSDGGGDLDTFHAASVYTLTHDYIQSSTPGRHIHVGVSFVPCGTLFIPLWLGENGMRALLAQWYEQKLPIARTEALVTVRLLDGGSSIRHAVPRLKEKHQHLRCSTSSMD
jgi:hypothetical protein